MQDRDELIALTTAGGLFEHISGKYGVAWDGVELPEEYQFRDKAMAALGRLRADAILAALESRPAPTEERAREVLREVSGAGPDVESKYEPWSVCITAMMKFVTDTTPSRDEEGSVDREAIARIIDPVSFGGGVNYSPGRARAALAKADAILALKPTTPERAKALEEALRRIERGFDQTLYSGKVVNAPLSGVTAQRIARNALSASPPEVVEQP